MGLFKELREFAARGNVVDLAVGVIIGGAFGKVVSSFVDDVLMPPVGKLLGGIDFSQLFIDLSGKHYATLAEAKAAAAATLNYGSFLQTCIDLGIVAFVVFLLVKAINAARRKQQEEPAASAPPPEEITLLREIRDALKK